MNQTVNPPVVSWRESVPEEPANYSVGGQMEKTHEHSDKAAMRTANYSDHELGEQDKIR